MKSGGTQRLLKELRLKGDLNGSEEHSFYDAESGKVVWLITSCAIVEVSGEA